MTVLRRPRARILHTPSAAWTPEQVRVALMGRSGSDDVQRFEAAASNALGIDVIAVGSARTGMYLVIELLGDRARRAIVPAFTCVAVPNAINTAGRPIVWIDIRELNLDLDAASSLLVDGDILIAQHTFGIPVDIAVGQLSRDVFVLEDRAHRFDSDGLAGDGAIFSLEHSKVLSAGQGGLVWVRDERLRRRIREARDELPLPSSGTARRIARTSAIQRLMASAPRVGGFGSLGQRIAYRVPATSMPANTHRELSEGRINPTRMHPLHARVGLLGLEGLARDLAHRRRLADRYERVLGSFVPASARGGVSVVRMPVVVEDAERLRSRLRDAGIEIGPRWFDAPVHPRGTKSSYRAGSAPRAELLATQIINLPMHALISPDDAEQLALFVTRFA